MQWDMRRPCDDCPFRKAGGIRLTKARAREIGGMMLQSQGGTFPCHKSVDHDRRDDSREVHCAGALIFAEKRGNATQMMRIAERLGCYDPARLDRAAFPLVFDSLRGMIVANGWKGHIRA